LVLIPIVILPLEFQFYDFTLIFQNKYVICPLHREAPRPLRGVGTAPKPVQQYTMVIPSISIPESGTPVSLHHILEINAT
jgi:hypothetical protein